MNTKKILKNFIIATTIFGILALFVSYSPYTTIPVSVAEYGSDDVAFTKQLTIIIDAGHGGMDAGVTGVNTGAFESDLNLEISKALKAELESRGHTGVMTRIDSNHLSTRRRFHKMDDMRAREKIIKDNKHDAVLSIHCNRFSGSARRGAQVFLQRGKDTTLGEFIQLHLNKIQEKKTAPQLKDFFILRCSPKPSAIIECGFLSNFEDEALLTNPTHHKKLAKTIVDGIENYFKTVNPQ